ncbi:uncharacterized protein LOC115086298 isoform X2 [Rhinatrema bivittatum]|uniref:uncharacterized protein LOC115086298 isoform X2 n=1 Tax=Rhinatrema bivittatum TaxID=194408 RepID=UPI00112BB0C9|nr:uncharacterized protein LOC115086298 isoform X2 [Rhinatrema bivittatum]
MNMQEVNSTLEIAKERCHKEEEKSEFISCVDEDGGEGNSRREPKDLCAHFYTPSRGHLYTAASESVIERSSVYEINASEKLDTFFNDKLRIQSEPSVHEDLEETPSGFYENIDVLYEGERSNAINSEVQKCQPPRAQTNQISVNSKKTMSLDEVCQVMDELNHVQLMICRFETPTLKNPNSRNPERGAERGREWQNIVEQGPEKRLRDQTPNLRDQNNTRSKEASEETANQHQTSSKEESYQHHDYSSRRQTPCDSEYDFHRSILCPPKVLEGVSSQENYRKLIFKQDPPKILDRCKVNHIKSCPACQNINQGRNLCARDMPTYENARLHLEEKKDCGIPSRSSSKISKEDKLFTVQECLEGTILEDFAGPSYRCISRRRSPDQSSLENPSWYFNHDQTLDKNCAVFWRTPEEDTENEEDLDSNTQPAVTKNNMRLWGMKSEEDPSNRQYQKQRACSQPNKNRERRSKSVPRPEVYSTLAEASAKLKAENRVQKVTDAFERRIRMEAKFTQLDLEKKDFEKEALVEGKECRARSALRLAGPQANRGGLSAERVASDVSTSKQTDMHFTKGQANATFKLQYYV